jgi:hypothetical protein
MLLGQKAGGQQNTSKGCTGYIYSKFIKFVGGLHDISFYSNKWRLSVYLIFMMTTHTGPIACIHR